jgi:hypothetical protein
MNSERQVGSSPSCARMAAGRCWVKLSRPRSLGLASTIRLPGASVRAVDTHLIEACKVP